MLFMGHNIVMLNPAFPWLNPSFLLCTTTCAQSTWSFAWRPGRLQSLAMESPGWNSVDKFRGKSYSYSHLPVITGYNWDYTFYKWGYKYL